MLSPDAPSKASGWPLWESLVSSFASAMLLQVFGMRALCISGFEADDIIGTLVHRATSEGMAVVLISPDKVSCVPSSHSNVYVIALSASLVCATLVILHSP